MSPLIAVLFESAYKEIKLYIYCVIVLALTLDLSPE